MNVRKAVREEIPAMSRMLARSFHDDPIVEWVFRDEATRPKYAARFFGGRARVLGPQDEIYTVEGVAGVAMWARPDEWRDPALKAAKELALLAPGVGRRMVQTVRGLIQVESRHPKPPHWYLAVLGTDPDRQGEGIGTALLQPVLEECDRHDIPAYLETGRERNVGFYNRHGFKVSEQLTLPNGPPIWLMWREPRP